MHCSFFRRYIWEGFTGLALIINHTRIVSVVMEHNRALYLSFLPLKRFTIFFLCVEKKFAEQALQTAFARFSQPFIVKFPVAEMKWLWALTLVPFLHYLLGISWPKPAADLQMGQKGRESIGPFWGHLQSSSLSAVSAIDADLYPLSLGVPLVY